MSENTQEHLNDDTIERVIVQDEVKLYRTKCPLFYLDGTVYDFSQLVIKYDGSPVPVYGDSGKKIGFAHLTRVGDKVFGDFVIEYNTEERLLAETKEIPLYPRVCANTETVPTFKVLDLVKPILLLVMEITAIQISRIKGSDSRLTRFGEPSW